MLEKWFNWTFDGIWFRLGCGRDRSKVIKSGGIGMKRAIATGHIETLKLLARLAIYGTPATPTTPQGYGISIAWIRDALAINASTAAIRTLLQVLNFHSINQNAESQDAYKTTLDRAKKNKDGGKWEAWIYNSLVAKKLLGGGTRKWDEWGKLFKESLRLAKTDPVAHLSSFLGTFTVTGCKGMIQILNGASIQQCMPIKTFLVGFGHVFRNGKAQMAAEARSVT